MNHIQDIIRRIQFGESERQIARDMQIARKTVHKYHEMVQQMGYMKGEQGQPSEAELNEALGPGVQAPRQVSSVEPYRESIERWVKQGVEMMAIWQRLKENHGYRGGYSSVRRFVRQLEPKEPEVFVRVHSEPGEDLQVDFAHVGKLYDPDSKRIRPAYVFVATLGYSRHQYAELTFDQKVGTWIRLHQNAFRFLGGVPRRVIPDNLKAAVLKALVYDPILAEAYRRLALYYQFLISPTIPHRPRHKGKVENGVHYVQRNFMAGQEFVDLPAANVHLRDWVMNTAGVRKHGTTGEAPLHLFHEFEKPRLQPLPAEPFQLLEIRLVKVHPDCHVVIGGNFYSVPFRYVGQQLAAHLSENFVGIYAGQELVASHPHSHGKGQWHTRLEDYPPAKAAFLIRTPDYCRKLGARIGPSTYHVVDELLGERPLDRLRSVQAILKLEESVGTRRLEAACARAVYYGDMHYRQIKEILNAALDCEPLPEAAEAQPMLSHVFARRGEEFFGRDS